MSAENTTETLDAAALAELSFEDIMEKLDGIAAQLEGGALKLETSLQLFEQGVRLSREGTKRLDAAEKRLEIVLENGSTEPFSLPEGPESGTQTR